MTAEERAIAAFEDAASRGFPNGDQVRLQMAIYAARVADVTGPIAAGVGTMEPQKAVADPAARWESAKAKTPSKRVKGG